MYKPYVVSEDIGLLLQDWAARNGFTMPSSEFFYRLREAFSVQMRRIFPSFELVSEREISQGLADLVAESGLPAVSLDKVYSKSELNFEITRLVDEKGKSCGWSNRAGTPPIPQQLEALRASGIKEAVLVDDVIFSGDMLEMITDLFLTAGIRVPLICAGIGIAEGIRRINGTRREVRCVRVFDQVIDEVCERDFYPGTPLSGRLLSGSMNIGVPYIFPFGNPEDWASIPSEHATTFSRFCLGQTILLFDEIERCSGREILCQDLGRKVFSLPANGVRYTDVLREVNGRSVLQN
ncbi:MAG: hypothetical protein WCX77_02965 [Candidatus Paceibacterota bacterium]|jgi:hypothetical protein